MSLKRLAKVLIRKWKLIQRKHPIVRIPALSLAFCQSIQQESSLLTGHIYPPYPDVTTRKLSKVSSFDLDVLFFKKKWQTIKKVKKQEDAHRNLSSVLVQLTEYLKASKRWIMAMVWWPNELATSTWHIQIISKYFEWDRNFTLTPFCFSMAWFYITQCLLTQLTLFVFTILVKYQSYCCSCNVTISASATSQPPPMWNVSQRYYYTDLITCTIHYHYYISDNHNI